VTTNEAQPAGQTDTSTSATSSAEPTRVDRQGSRGTSGKVSLYFPFDLCIPEIDGPLLGVTPEDAARIAKLPEWERPAAEAPFRVAGLLAEFAGNDLACAIIDAALDDRSTQPLSPEFVASTECGISEPVLATVIGNRKDGSPCVMIYEGRQRDRAERYNAGVRAKEGLPPRTLPVVLRTFTSARKLREIKVSTSNHVQLSPIQKAHRYQELVENNVAPDDAAKMVGWRDAKSARSGLEILKRDGSVQDAVASGGITAQTAKSLRYLSAGEQRSRVEQIKAVGATGRKARQIATSGTASDSTTKAPPRSVLENLSKRLVASKDPILIVVGSALTWSLTGDETGLEKAPGLAESVGEETAKYHGLSLSVDDRERLGNFCEAGGGVPTVATKIGVNASTIARGMAGLKLKLKVRAAILKAIAPAPAPADKAA
jgi:ParB-like chromosome segregation protein Spo0J